MGRRGSRTTPGGNDINSLLPEKCRQIVAPRLETIADRVALSLRLCTMFGARDCEQQTVDREPHVRARPIFHVSCVYVEEWMIFVNR